MDFTWSLDRGRQSASYPESLFGRNEPTLRSPEKLDSGGYDEYFDPPLENKYECPICLLGLREPVQTLCGHTFCRSCFLRSIRDAVPKCPLDKEHLDEWQFFADNFVKREVINHPVFCRLKKLHGCPWKGPLSKLEDHLKECGFVDVFCPKNCGKEFQRKDLKKHLEDDCPNRKISCTFCAEEVSWNRKEFEEVYQLRDTSHQWLVYKYPVPIINHYQDCPRYPLPCEKCGKQNIPRNEIQDHNEKECPRAELRCLFYVVGCPFEGPRPAVNEHVEEQMFSHLMDLTKEFGALTIEQPGLQALKSRFRHTRRGVEAREQSNQHVPLSNLATFCQQQETQIHRVRDLSNEMRRALERMRVETPLQEHLIRSNCQETRTFVFEGHVSSSPYIWRLENFRERREKAINDPATAVYSPAFYTSFPGYKMYLRINLNGVDSGVGKYIALFVHMMQGDYDDDLEWPFTGRITVTILDQSEFGHHIGESFNAQPDMSAFERLTTAPRNDLGCGFVKFTPIEHILSPQYIKDNTMLVRIQIDPGGSIRSN